MVVSVGKPYRQLRCHLQVGRDGGVITEVSGALKTMSLTIDLSQQPRVEFAEFGSAVHRAVRVITDLTGAIPGGHTTGDAIRDFYIASATKSRVVLVPQGRSWSLDAQEDLSLYLDQEARVVTWEHITARTTNGSLVASRVIWFPDYNAP
jgi:hypothetical protein